MLEHVDESIEAFLRAEANLGATDVDVSFDAPDHDWSAKINRATVNVFLWDIRRSAERSRSGIQTVVRDGVRVHQPAFPMVEMRYVVTAWTTKAGDERELLGDLLKTFLSHNDIPRAYLSDIYTDLQPPSLELARAGEDHMDVFKALEGKVKPGLNVVLSTEIDVGLGHAAGPPVGAVESRIGQIDGRRLNGRTATSAADFAPDTESTLRRVAGDIVDAANIGAIGAVVRSSIDASRVNPTGRFLIQAATGDTITLETDPPRSATVPAEGGVRFD